MILLPTQQLLRHRYGIGLKVFVLFVCLFLFLFSFFLYIEVFPVIGKTYIASLKQIRDRLLIDLNEQNEK